MRILVSMASRHAAVVAIIAALVACGGGSNGPAPVNSNPTPPATSVPPLPSSISLSGSVGDGPLTGSTIVVTSASGEQIASTSSDAQATYSLELPAGLAYPLRLTATGGVDAVTNAEPTFTLASIAVNAGQVTANLTPHTTLIIATAEAMDIGTGLTSTNITEATSILYEQLSFGLDTSTVSNIVTTPTSAATAPHIIKAGEALAEMIKRTASIMRTAGIELSEDEIIQLIGNDFADGVLDGRAPGSDARVAATATIVSAQILIETMINELHVNGSEATGALDGAIALSVPASSITSANVPISGALLTQARIATQAALTLSPSAAVEELIALLETLTPNSSAASIKALLPSDVMDRLGQGMSDISNATAEQLEAINGIVRDGGAASGPPPPPPPVISGTPALLYSDLVAGPPGAFVTLWGHAIPSDAEFTCGDEPCDVISLDFDPHHPAHGNQPSRQKLVVRFNSGSGITLNGFNTLPYEVNAGRIWEATPGPIGPTLDAMNSGDVLYLREGAYDVNDGGTFGAIIWATQARQGLAVIGYPGERVVLELSAGLSGFDSLNTNRDWTIANMECNGFGSAGTQCITASRNGTRTNLRVVGMYSHDTAAGVSGAFGAFGSTQNLHVLGNFSENTGVAGNSNAHVLYHVGQGENDNVNFEFNRIRNHVGGRAIQVYGHAPGETMDGLRIRYNNIENIQGRSDAILISHSDSDPNAPASSLTRAWINDALIQGNTTHGVSRSGIAIRAAVADIVIIDNVSYNNGSSVFIDFVKTAQIMHNCFDAEPSLNQTVGVILQDNRFDHPSCLQ